MKNGWYDKNGYFAHYLNNVTHNNDVPAIIGDNGNRYWGKNNQLHRIDGPACEYFDGYKEWLYQGEKIDCKSQQEFERFIKLKLLW